jgi:HrpA-like RNA helicase
VHRQVRDPYLPPDHQAFVAAEPPSGRIIVIAPTRAACETIEIGIGLHLDTFLDRQHGPRIRALAREGKGFGIVAGTGTGKTLAIRPIAEEIVGTPLRIGVVNREREATPETPTWNVVIVTTGIARRWFQDGDILPRDTLVVDEIHQTSAELELCLALGKKVGCRFIWLSATVDPTFYASYLGSEDVIESYSFDPTRAARVEVQPRKPLEFLDERFLKHVLKGKRGVGVFLPTRAGVEGVAEHVRRLMPRINAAYYHGGEPIRVIRPFLEGEGEQKPYVLAMTAAGQSALNVRGLDTVVIDDVRFTNVIDKGRNVLTQLHLGANEILQMGGRVHGRVEGGRVFILSDREIDFFSLRPTAPEFQLAGDSERVAITCADLGVRADELELPVPLDRVAYRQAVSLLERRGIIENGRLSRYGKLVEAMPVDRPWAELLVNADDDLVAYVAVMSGIESLHRMTREDRDLRGLIVNGSDHLTAYNLYAEAYRRAGRIGEVYGLPRHLFDDETIQEWAEERGVLVKSIEDAALSMASIYRAIGLPLPAEMTLAGDRIQRRFEELLARFMPFDLVIDEQTADGQDARVSKTSVAGSWGPIAGTLRYFADRFGIPRASIEGTNIPKDLVRKYATHGDAELLYDPDRKRSALALRRRVEYFGFELEREVEPLEEPWNDEIAPGARHVLADALARSEARHLAVRRNRDAIDRIREVYRRSGGVTPRLNQADLAAIYEAQLGNVRSLDDFMRAQLRVDADAMVSRDEQERWMALPDGVLIRDREVPIEYDVEEGADGSKTAVARLRLTEKVARTLTDAEIPALDRPLRFVVPRGQRGAARASTLEEIQDLLDQPWTQDEINRLERQRDQRREEHKREHRERNARGALRRGRADSRGDGRRDRSEGRGGNRAGGYREGGARDGSARGEGGQSRDGGNREGGNRDGANREGGNREGGRSGSSRDGGARGGRGPTPRGRGRRGGR